MKGGWLAACVRGRVHAACVQSCVASSQLDATSMTPIDDAVAKDKHVVALERARAARKLVLLLDGLDEVCVAASG